MTAAPLPVWRSLLFVPVTAQRFVDGAARRGADAIILDLEDSVAASEKERARTLVPEAAEIVSRGGADVVVRINRPLRMAVRDIEAAVGPRRAGAGPAQGGQPRACPARSPRSSTRSRPSAAWRRARRGCIAMVETARGVLPHRRDRPRPSAALRPQPRRRGFRHRRPGSCPRPRASSCRSRWRSSPPAPPASCRWALSARSPSSTISTASAQTIRRSRRLGFIGAWSSIRARSDPQRGVPRRRRGGRPRPPRRRRLRQGARRGCRRRHRRRQDDRRAGRRARQASSSSAKPRSPPAKPGCAGFRRARAHDAWRR